MINVFLTEIILILVDILWKIIMNILNAPKTSVIYNAVNSLHKDLSDDEILANYNSLAFDAGYTVIKSSIDRTNQMAPSLSVSVHPHGNSDNTRNFTILLLANTANIGVVFAKDGENYLLVRVQDKAGYLQAVSVPGGHKELADSDISETARRELMEEVGGVKIPAGSKTWVGDCTSVSLCNNATNTDTEALIWVNPNNAEEFINSIDWNTWSAVRVKDAPAVVTHGSSKPVALSALVFEFGGTIAGTFGITS